MGDEENKMQELGKRAELRGLLQEAAEVAKELGLSPADFLLSAMSGWNNHASTNASRTG